MTMINFGENNIGGEFNFGVYGWNVCELEWSQSVMLPGKTFKIL